MSHTSHVVIKLEEATPLAVLKELLFRDSCKIRVMRTELYNGLKLPKIIRVFYDYPNKREEIDNDNNKE